MLRLFEFGVGLPGTGAGELKTDLAERISTTGTEQKASNSHTGTKFTISFAQMSQRNDNSGTMPHDPPFTSHPKNNNPRHCGPLLLARFRQHRRACGPAWEK